MNDNGHRLVAEYEGPPRFTARLCEGGAWELGKGITFNLNGEPFKEGDTCTPEYADALYKHALKQFEDGVRELVTVPLNSNQFSALVAFAYNVGLENFRTSSVLRRVNENRMDDAAVCFGMWLYATKNGHKQALRGLLRRRYAEACLFMGYDWTQACDIDAIALQREIPDPLPGTDRVIYKTPFKDVLSVAQRYPLAPADELVLTQPAPPLVATTRVPDGKAEQPGADPQSQPPVVSAPKVSPAPSVSVVPPASVAKPSEAKPTATPAAPRTAPVPAPLPPVGGVIVRKDDPIPPSPEQQRAGVNGSTTPGIDPTSAKSMLLSRRFWGLLMIITGRVVFAFYGADTLLKLGSDPLISEMFANVMVLIASSAWEYCGECLHTWGKARARRALK